MQCLHCRIIIQLGHWRSSPPAPNEKRRVKKNRTAKQHWSESLAELDEDAQFPVHKRKRANGGFGGIQRRKKANGGKSCSLQFDLKILSGSFTIMLQGKFRTRISELICKHRVLPEAAETGHFTFPFSRRELSGRYRHTMLHQTGSIPRDFC